MNLLREYIRGLLTEGELKYSGILKLMPSADIVVQATTIAETLPKTTTVPWSDDPKLQESELPVLQLKPDKFHVTLAHQSVMKPYKKQLKPMNKMKFQGLVDENGDPLVPPVIKLNPKWIEKTDIGLQRRSYVAEVLNQRAVGTYLNNIMKVIGGPMNIWETEDPIRKFHVSLANLTGNPGDSVR